MLKIDIERFGGSINPENNSIVLSVVAFLSTEINGIVLSQTKEMVIPVGEAEIYNLVYLLQPLVYQYCEQELKKPKTQPPPETIQA